MNSRLPLFLLLIVTFVVTGCKSSEPPEQFARDTIASASGFLAKAQSDHLVECQAAPTKALCVDINKGIVAQRTLADSLAIYCAGPAAAGNLTYANGGPCSPVTSYLDALKAATSTLSNLVTDIKQLMGQANLATDPLLERLNKMQLYLSKVREA